MVWGSGESNATFYLLRNIKYMVNVRILLVVAVYDEFDPVPGGCNLTFDTVLAPYQLTSYNDEYITVKSQPPSAYGVSCDTSKIKVDMFHLYLPEYDRNNETYFDGIEKMLSVEDILRYGTKVPEIEGYFKFRRLYSSYRGTGEVFGMIATYNNKSAAYVPAVSYGCDLMDWDQNCIGPVTGFWKFVCALLLIFGLFVCFLGHRFFKVTLYIIGFTFGVFITYLTISLEQNLTVNEKAITSFVVGFLYGIFWTFIWWKFGIPLLSVNLVFVLSGCLVASVIYYAGVADIDIFTNDINFWVIFLSIILGCLIIFVPFTRMSHIVTCSFVGSYACITAMNHYVGGNLQYIIINTFRRATVKHFNYAVIDPPFQMLDIVNSFLWVVLFLFGVFVQIRDQHGKPPFPPNRSGIIRAARVTESTPLIHPETVAAPEYV
nr:transmembrane 7 superfamily member 3-like [Leptinotarsa decemlineata]